MNSKQKHLSLKYDEATFRIIKQRKNRYIRNHKYEKLREFCWKLNCKGIISFRVFKWICYGKE